MVSFINQRANYMEIVALSADVKPGSAEGVPNGSLLTEIDSGRTYRYNVETGEWIKQGDPYPVNLESKDGEYIATYSDGYNEPVDPEIKNGVAYIVHNGVKVSCAVQKAKSGRKK